ncbi:MAG TPA: histidine--tRNA ligase, partial [Chloroflexi bacterium]|nr:histidine--tRNA ligase [Chloroflexota bacterium]
MAKPTYRRTKGMQDVLPDEQRYWRVILKQMQRAMDLFGFQRIDTPLLELAALFKRSVGQGTDIVEKEMYIFEDRDGEILSLRPEFTAGLMRAYIQNGLHVQPPPVKLWTAGPLFRHERQQKGRYRQHSQLNIEVLSESDPAVDAEIISVAWHLFDNLGITGLNLHLNSTGCPICKPDYIQRLSDYFKQYESLLPEDDLRRLRQNPLRILDTKEESTQQFLDKAPKFADHLCEDCQQHQERLQSYLNALEIPFQIDFKLVRGLDYYTKTVFEIKAPGSLGSQDTVCGGGRYDKLIEMLGGRPTPGIGFGSGIERIALTMQAQGIEAPPTVAPLAFIAWLGEAAKVEAVKLAAKLRRAGIPVQLAFGDRSLKSQMKSANRRNARYVIIIGENELAKGEATVRNLTTRVQ